MKKQKAPTIVKVMGLFVAILFLTFLIIVALKEIPLDMKNELFDMKSEIKINGN